MAGRPAHPTARAHISPQSRHNAPLSIGQCSACGDDSMCGRRWRTGSPGGRGRRDDRRGRRRPGRLVRASAAGLAGTRTNQLVTERGGAGILSGRLARTGPDGLRSLRAATTRTEPVRNPLGRRTDPTPLAANGLLVQVSERTIDRITRLSYTYSQLIDCSVNFGEPVGS